MFLYQAGGRGAYVFWLSVAAWWISGLAPCMSSHFICLQFFAILAILWVENSGRGTSQKACLCSAMSEGISWHDSNSWGLIRMLQLEPCVWDPGSCSHLRYSLFHTGLFPLMLGLLLSMAPGVHIASSQAEKVNTADYLKAKLSKLHSDIHHILLVKASHRSRLRKNRFHFLMWEWKGAIIGMAGSVWPPLEA